MAASAPDKPTLPSRGLTLAQYASAKRLPIALLRQFGLRDESYFGASAVAMPYRDRSGAEIALRYRLALEGDRFRWRRGDRPALYGLDRLPATSSYVVIVEGESDVQTLAVYDEPAVGVPGVATWRDEWASELAGFAVVYVIREPDGGGEALLARLAGSPLRARIRVIRLALKDPSALHLDDPDQFKPRWAAVLEAAEPLPLVEDLSDTIDRIGRERGETPPRDAVPDGIRAMLASSVTRQRVEYLDVERSIPLRAVTVLAGAPGLGKSQWAIRLTAANLGVTLIATAEDSIAAVVRPRLEAAGADLERVRFVVMRREGNDENIDLPDDVTELDRLVAETGATLVIVDPLMAHLPESVNSWRDQSIRRALAPLHRLAEERGCAIVVIVHLNKREGDDPVQRVGGSIGIAAAARSVLLLARDPDDPEGEAGSRRVLAHVKSNYGPLRPSLALRIEAILVDPEGEHIETSRIVVTGESPHLGRDLLAAGDREERGKRGEATAFLLDQLRDGPQPSLKVIEGGSGRGFSERTIKRAKGELGVKSVRVGFGKEGEWHWILPGAKASAIDGPGPVSDLAAYDGRPVNIEVPRDREPIDGHAPHMAPFGKDGADPDGGKWIDL